MGPKAVLAFVERSGIVLEAARGPLPSLAETIAGGPIRGSWWGHARGREIFRATQTVYDRPDDVLVCRLANGKVTYVHRRLWPALVKLANRFRRAQLARVWNEHTPSGAHRLRMEAFPRWVPADVARQAEALSVSEAEALLAPWLSLGASATKRPRSRRPLKR